MSAGLLRALLFGGMIPGRLTTLGLRLRSGQIEGKLDLAGLSSAEAPAAPLVLRDMNRREGSAGLDLNISGATLAELDLRGTHLARAVAADLTLRRRLLLNRCRLREGGRLRFDRAQIGIGVFLSNAVIESEVRFPGAEIGGQFSARAGTKLTRTDSVVLFCGCMQVKGDLLLDGAVIEGGVRFLGAEIGGQFNANAAKMIAHADGDSLACHFTVIKGDVFYVGPS